MHFIILIITSLIVFIVARLIFALIYESLCKLFKSSGKDNMSFGVNLLFSLAFLGIYIQAFSGALQAVEQYMKTSLELYLVLVSIGVISMLWCYFRWDFKFKSRPRFGVNDKMTIIKKIFVYAVVMCFTFYYGYTNINKLVYGQEIDMTIMITNATIIPIIIALDRILNQIMNFIKQKE